MKDSNVEQLVSTIRQELSQIEKFESFLRDFNKEVEEADKSFTTREDLDSVTEEEVADFVLRIIH